MQKAASRVSPLRKLREDRGLSTHDVARLIGTTPTTVSKHERGLLEMSGSAIDRYRRLYNVKTLALFLHAEDLEAKIA